MVNFTSKMSPLMNLGGIFNKHKLRKCNFAIWKALMTLFAECGVSKAAAEFENVSACKKVESKYIWIKMVEESCQQWTSTSEERGRYVEPFIRKERLGEESQCCKHNSIIINIYSK